MGISGISFLVEMDRPLDKISPDAKPFVPISLNYGDRNSCDETMYFSSFDMSIDEDDEKTIYVEAYDPKDIDGNPIEDNRRMGLGPRNNGVPSILKEPLIKGMIEGQKAAKSRDFNR